MYHGMAHILLTYAPLGPQPLLVTSGGDHRRHVQTCSFQDLPSPPPFPPEATSSGCTETETGTV